MNRLYIQFEFDARVHGIRVRCNGTKGYDILQSDGSCDGSEYAEALNRMLLVLRSGEDALITFGNDSMMEFGYGRQYGRLIRNWCRGKLTCVLWDGNGNVINTLEKGDGVSDRSFARMFIDIMLAAHREAEAETN